LTVTRAGYPTLRGAHHFFALTLILASDDDRLMLIRTALEPDRSDGDEV
jgi:hypothetical protein